MTRVPRPQPARARRRLLVPLLAGASLAAGGLGASSLSAATTTAAPADRGGGNVALQPAAAAGNPLAGRPWGVYKGRAEQSWEPYATATGTRKKLLAKIALRPKAKWFGGWIPDGEIAGKVRTYITNAQAGNPETLVPMTIFRMRPWEREACRRLPTAAERASYKTWTNRFAGAIGSAHAAIVLQPDGPFALCAPGGSKVPSSLIAYSAKKFSSLPNTSVYIEAGAADWPAPGSQGGVAAAVRILVRGGVRYARGFALNGTHYSSTPHEVARGAAIVKGLEAKGIHGKHFVVNTSSNGHPFVFGDYTGADPNNAAVCRTRSEPAKRTCVTLGIPPTTKVTSTRWRLPATTRALAARYVDAYMWFGRPWLYRQADPFVMSRALRLVRTTPY
jgi:endoglucanase